MTKILGIGNAVLDILAKISEKDLKKRKLFKGSMSLVAVSYTHLTLPTKA